MNKTVITSIVAAFLAVTGLVGCQTNNTEKPVTAPVTEMVVTEGNLDVHFLDVGQGDSIFTELPDGKTMLIDASEQEYGTEIVSYIRELGYDKIDYVVATHPHSDHIGGMAEVLDSLGVDVFYMPEKEHTTKTFEKMLNAVAENGCAAKFIKAGDTLFEGQDYIAEVLAPIEDSYEEMNNWSAVIRLSYGDTAFLFTGDAESLSERQILDSGATVTADVLKVGHHGSKSSSTKAFINAVMPKYAVISCGVDNEYGFPKESVVKRLKEAGATVLITSEEGTIVMTSDGKAVSKAS